MLLPVIGSLRASLVWYFRQPDASCTLSHVQTNKQTNKQTCGSINTDTEMLHHSISTECGTVQFTVQFMLCDHLPSAPHHYALSNFSKGFRAEVIYKRGSASDCKCVKVMIEWGVVDHNSWDMLNYFLYRNEINRLLWVCHCSNPASLQAVVRYFHSINFVLLCNQVTPWKSDSSQQLVHYVHHLVTTSVPSICYM